MLMISLCAQCNTVIHSFPFVYLSQLSWMLDRRSNPQRAQEALSTLSDKVKLGTLRATYIAQDSGDTTLVTLNAGVKEDPV